MSRLRQLLLVAGLVFSSGCAAADGPILHEFDVEGSVYSLAFAPDGKLLAAQVGSQIYVWDLKTGKELRRIAEEPAAGIWSVAFSPDSKTVYAPLEDHSIAAWEVATGKLVRQFKGHTSTVWSATVSPDGKLLASGGEDLTVRLWNTSTGAEVAQLTHGSGVWPFQFTRDGKELVSISSDGKLSIWDLAGGTQKKQFFTEASAWPLALSADGRTVATMHWQSTTARLFDLKTGKETRSLNIHSGTGWNLAFSPDGRTLAAGGPDNTLCLWEAATGKERLRLAGYKNKIDALDYARDGRRVASASSDGKVIVWDVTERMKEGRLAPASPTPAEFDALWQDLAGVDGTKAQRAVWTLTAAGDQIVGSLFARVRKLVPAPFDNTRVEKRIAELDDDEFQVRERASAELEKLGPAALPALRKVLEKSTSAERTRRLTALVEKFGKGDDAPEVIAGRRAVEVLEQIGTPVAGRALEDIVAEKKAMAEIVEEAQRSLRRLAGRR
jgi:Tol biopolymer transport system component